MRSTVARIASCSIRKSEIGEGVGGVEVKSGTTFFELVWAFARGTERRMAVAINGILGALSRSERIFFSVIATSFIGVRVGQQSCLFAWGSLFISQDPCHYCH